MPLTSRPTLRRLAGAASTVARSRITGALIILASLWVIVDRWNDASFAELADVGPLAIIGAGALYSVAPVALAFGAFGSLGQRWAGAGLATQLLKYLPGTIWQAHPIYSVAGGPGVLRYGLVVLLSASIALTLSGLTIAVILGTAGLLGVTAVLLRREGAGPTVRFLASAAVAAAALTGSGMALAAPFHLDAGATGTAIASGWGAGVWAVPVPAGLGVREAFLAIVGGVELAPLVAAHRVITLVVDGAVGAVGLLMLRSHQRD